MSYRKYAVQTLYQILLTVYNKGRVSSNDLKKMLGSSRRRDLWLSKILLKLNFLKCDVEKVGKKEVKYYRLTLDGFQMLESMLNHKIFEAYCMTTKSRKVEECYWARREEKKVDTKDILRTALSS